MTDPTTPVRRRRWIAAALAVSLALNLFFLGAAAVQGWRWYSGERRHASPVFSAEWRGVLERLPREDRERIGRELRRLLPDFRAQRDELRRLVRELLVLAAEPEPDRAAIAAKQTEIRAVTSAMQATAQDRAFSVILDLPPAVRRHLAEP